MPRVMKRTNMLLLHGVLVPSPPQYFRYSLKQFPHLPHLLTETLCPLSIFFFTVPLVKTIDRATKAHLLLSRES